MKWRILTIGKPALAYARTGAEEYLKRLRKHTEVELRHLRDVPEPRATQSLLEASEGCLRIVLDERGRSDLDTRGLAGWVGRQELDPGVREIALLIGGADGHNDERREKADLLLALSPFTLQHELALVVLLEQLYRVYTIRAGMPYHR